MRQGTVLQLIRKLCDGVSCGRTFIRVLLKQWIVANFLCDREYFWAILDATGYSVWRALPHTPDTSLVKYPLPGWDYVLSLDVNLIKILALRNLQI